MSFNSRRSEKKNPNLDEHGIDRVKYPPVKLILDERGRVANAPKTRIIGEPDTSYMEWGCRILQDNYPEYRDVEKVVKRLLGEMRLEEKA